MLSRKGGPAGKRFVTEATLIYSSRRSDGINVSRDDTFAQHLKSLSWALVLSCLIVWWISYDKQTGLVVGGGKELGQRGMHSAARACSAAGSRCFCKWPLCPLQRGSESEFWIKIWLLLNLINLGRTLPSTPATGALTGPPKKRTSTLGQTLNRCCRAANH